jgi:hypothetical protein
MLTLGAVCKKWREIAWATPELWTFLRMSDVPESDCSSFSLQVELAKEWLGRAANLPLSISLKNLGQKHSLKPISNPHVGTLITILNSYSRRWKCLDICVPKMYLSLFHNLPSESAQNEPERFQHFQLGGFGLRNKTRVPFNANGKLLKPTKVTLGLLYVRPLRLRVDWGNVTSLNCGSLFLDEFLELIQLASSMTDFTVGIADGHDCLPPDAFFIHSQLRKLTITQLQSSRVTTSDAAAIDVLFSKLTLPSLESFSCEFSWERGIQRWIIYPAPLLEFFARSLPPLRYLFLSKVTMTSAQFSHLMTYAPLLEEVEIMLEEQTSCFNDFLKPLDAGLRHELPIFRIPADVRLPQLRSIKYVYRGQIAGIKSSASMALLNFSARRWEVQALTVTLTTQDALDVDQQVPYLVRQSLNLLHCTDTYQL